MVVLYAIALVLGLAGVVVWMLAGLLAANPNSRIQDPAEHFGDVPREVAMAVLGIGIGGMSASFAGWPATLAVLASIGGAALLLLAVRIIEHDEPVESGEAGT